MNTIKNTVATRVKQLQKWMEEERLDAFIVPTIDPHNSEYTPDHWKAREWLTGFDGSAGTAVVLAENGGALWTDSRYFLQAEEQLNGMAPQKPPAGRQHRLLRRNHDAGTGR